MARIITKEHAERIVAKLGGKRMVGKNHVHDLYLVFEDGVVVTKLSIRRGSERDQGHDHMLNDLYLNGHKTRLLAQCPLQRKQWIEILKTKGVIAPPSAEP